MTQVVSLFGGPSGEKEVVEGCVNQLQRYMNMAQSGEICGVLIVALHHDAAASWQLGGRVGGYSMVGSLEMAKAELIDINRDLA